MQNFYVILLARDKRLDAAVLNDLLARAGDMGFAAKDLIFVDQQPD